jgi:hypothetical protein
MRKSLAAFLFAVFTAMSPRTTSAQPITIPTGLNPGDQYRLAFVTSATRDATSPNIADYNAFVTTDANSVPQLAALGTTWSAIASTASVDARDNTSTSPLIDYVGAPIYTLANTLIAPFNAALWFNDILVPLNITEAGTPRPGAIQVWTGSLPGGIGYPGYPLGNSTPLNGAPTGSDNNTYGPGIGWVYGSIPLKLSQGMIAVDFLAGH